MQEKKAVKSFFLLEERCQVETYLLSVAGIPVALGLPVLDAELEAQVTAAWLCCPPGALSGVCPETLVRSLGGLDELAWEATGGLCVEVGTGDPGTDTLVF